MPRTTTPVESSQVNEAPDFVPYAIDVATKQQHDVLHTALNIYSKSLESISKRLEAVGASKDNVVALLTVCDDIASLLDGQFSLFNNLGQDDDSVLSDTEDLFPDDDIDFSSPPTDDTDG